ncbi:hypothetical protein ANO11243_051630 [Dothideomycetidae sp. 11243]|nr:hypothetical protein ANO11243_051630 [fungal sp. No.11243]
MSSFSNTVRGGQSVDAWSSSREASIDPEWEDADEADEDDDDDMEYEETEEDVSDSLDGSEIEIEFQDASEELTSENTDDAETTSGNGDATPTANGAAPQRTILTLEDLEGLITQRQLLRLLGGAGVRHVFASDGALRVQLNSEEVDDEDEDEDYNQGRAARFGYRGWGRRVRRRKASEEYKWPPVPNPEGQKLIDEGVFGTNEVPRDTLTRRKKKKLAYRTMIRELGLETPGMERGQGRLLRQDMIPSSRPDMVINYRARGYCGQFSDDGNFFFTCSQDFRVRMYDTANPYRWKYYKTARYYGGNWTITDATLSPDNKYLAYSSIRPQACLSATDPNDTSEPHSLDFGNLEASARTRGGRGTHNDHWGIWSLRFSGDGREIVAGTSDPSILVYDIDAGCSILKIPGHKDDVNAVCYGDKSSPHILFSGSDDATLKVWDRRSLGDQRAAGAFLGHTEGLTYIDSKGDGRYVISNAKDQTLKLWDLRKMIPQEKAETIDPMKYSNSFDYRYPPYDESERQSNPHDCSLVTFRGHKVYNTLIRCHFSPPGSTDGRYVYSGSADGSIWIWNMDGSVRSSLPVSADTHATSRGTGYDHYDMFGSNLGHRILRDVSWHPNAPIIATTSWNGGDHNSGTTTVHSWNDGADDDEADPPMGLRVTSELMHEPELRTGPYRRTRASQRVALDEDEEEGRGLSL